MTATPGTRASTGRHVAAVTALLSMLAVGCGGGGGGGGSPTPNGPFVSASTTYGLRSLSQTNGTTQCSSATFTLVGSLTAEPSGTAGSATFTVDAGPHATTR